MGIVEELLRKRLQNTFKLYVRHAIEHALNEEACEIDIIQVIINLQGSLELLTKLYILQKKGWRSIVDTRFHEKDEEEILSDIGNGKLITSPYWKNMEMVSKEIILNDTDNELIEKFKNIRNQIMHLGVINPSREILNESIWFLVRIINQLSWQDTLPASHQYMANSLECLLGEELYNKLITSSCYVDEAVDRAYEFYDDVKRCIQCGKEAWVVNGEEDRVCIVCGFRGYEGHFGFTDCPECGNEDSVLYDPLNIESNNFIEGKCCLCRQFVQVSKCPGCGNVFIFPGNCAFCSD